MDLRTLEMNRVDLHLHTLVSDGAHTPPEMLRAAAGCGLKVVSLTDHDAIGAYRHWPDIFLQAKSLGLSLLPGVELDTRYRYRGQEQEVHLLGYGFNLEDPALNEHLERVQEQRRLRIADQLRQINRFFGYELVSAQEVFLRERDCLMKPHLVPALLQTGQCGTEYSEVSRWISEHASSAHSVEKIPLSSAITLLHQAGGKAVLAHPGFLKGFSVEEAASFLGPILDELQGWGLDGVEVAYNYRKDETEEGAREAEDSREALIVSAVASLCRERSLLMTRGSDAHQSEKIAPFAQRLFQV